MKAQDIPARGTKVSLLGNDEAVVHHVARTSTGLLVTVLVEDDVEGVPVPAPLEDHSGAFTGTTGPREEPGRREPVEVDNDDPVDEVRPGDENVNDLDEDPEVVAAAVNEHVGDDEDHEPSEDEEDAGE